MEQGLCPRPPPDPLSYHSSPQRQHSSTLKEKVVGEEVAAPRACPRDMFTLPQLWPQHPAHGVPGGGHAQEGPHVLDTRHLDDPAHVGRVDLVLDEPAGQVGPLLRTAAIDGESWLRVLVLALLQLPGHLLAPTRVWVNLRASQLQGMLAPSHWLGPMAP